MWYGATEQTDILLTWSCSTVRFLSKSFAYSSTVMTPLYEAYEDACRMISSRSVAYSARLRTGTGFLRMLFLGGRGGRGFCREYITTGDIATCIHPVSNGMNDPVFVKLTSVKLSALTTEA
jgi:hypothetical protein